MSDDQALPQEDKFVEVDAKEYKAEIKDEVTSEVTETLSKEFDTKLEERTQAIQEEATTQATQKAKEALAESLVGKPKPEPTTPWGKEGRQPKNYEEVVEEGARQGEERAMARLKADQEAKDKKAATDKEEQDKIAKENLEVNNKMWDSQLDDLQSQGLIPKSSEEAKKKYAEAMQMTPNSAERNKLFTELQNEDEGFKARAEVQRLASANWSDTDKNARVMPNLKVAYYEHYNKQPAGANAPVFGAGKSVSSEPEGAFSYEDIQGKKASEVYEESMS